MVMMIFMTDVYCLHMLNNITAVMRACMLTYSSFHCWYMELVCVVLISVMSGA